jgi:hypothetical protein
MDAGPSDECTWLCDACVDNRCHLCCKQFTYDLHGLGIFDDASWCDTCAAAVASRFESHLPAAVVNVVMSYLHAEVGHFAALRTELPASREEDRNEQLDASKKRLREEPNRRKVGVVVHVPNPYCNYAYTWLMLEEGEHAAEIKSTIASSRNAQKKALEERQTESGANEQKRKKKCKRRGKADGPLDYNEEFDAKCYLLHARDWFSELGRCGMGLWKGRTEEHVALFSRDLMWPHPALGARIEFASSPGDSDDDVQQRDDRGGRRFAFHAVEIPAVRSSSSSSLSSSSASSTSLLAPFQ